MEFVLEFFLHFPAVVLGWVDGVFAVLFRLLTFASLHCMDRTGRASWNSMTYDRE